MGGIKVKNGKEIEIKDLTIKDRVYQTSMTLIQYFNDDSRHGKISVQEHIVIPINYRLGVVCWLANYNIEKGGIEVY